MGGRTIDTYNFGEAGTYNLRVSISQSDIETLGSKRLVHQESKSIVAKGSSEQDLKESFKNYLKKERIDLLNRASEIKGLESALEDNDLKTVNEYYQTLRNKMEGGN